MSLKHLPETYHDPLRAARAGHDAGLPLIGCIGVGIPEEVILASGAMPTALVPKAEGRTPIADTFMDPGEQPELRSLLEQIAQPSPDFMTLAVLTAPYGGLAETIEDLRRADLLPNAVAIHYFELQAEQSDASYRYAADRIRALASRMGAVTGQYVTDEKLSDAIAATNLRRQALRRFNAARREAPLISGTEAFQAIGAARFLQPAAFTAALEDMLASLHPDQSLNGRPRVLLIPSEPLTHSHAHEAIEAAGALVIGEDDPLGARGAESDIRSGGDPVQAIATHYVDAIAGARSFPAVHRLNWFHAQAVKPDVDAVIFYGQNPRYGWDHPAMRQFLESQGKLSLFIRADARNAGGFAQVESTTRAFITSLRDQAA